MKTIFKKEVLTLKVLCITIVTVLLSVVNFSCVSTPAPVVQQVQAVAPVEPIKTQTKLIDWQGAEFGDPVPQWVRDVSSQNTVNLESLEGMEGKYVLPMTLEGQDLEMMKVWVKTHAGSEISTCIQQTITTEMGSAQQGSFQTEGGKKIANEVIGVFASESISGLSNNRSFWTKVQLGDGTTAYRYYFLYSIDKEDLDYQIARALGKVKAETQEEEKAIDEIQKLIKVSELGKTNIKL